MKKQKSVFQKVLDIVIWVFLAFALGTTILAVAANFSGKPYPVIGKTVFLTVQSSSMDDGDKGEGFAEGDLIIGRVIGNTADDNCDLCEVGDVVTFYLDLNGDGEKELDTHKIIEKKVENNQVYYVCRGINPKIAETDTQTVISSEVQAVWTGHKIKGLGNVVDFFQSSTGFLIFVVVPMGILFFYELINLVTVINKAKAEKAPKVALSKEEEELIKQKAIEEYLAKQANKDK